MTVPQAEITYVTEAQREDYKTDHMLVNYDHTIVPLPRYMCDLNPVEVTWA